MSPSLTLILIPVMAPFPAIRELDLKRLALLQIVNKDESRARIAIYNLDL